MAPMLMNITEDRAICSTLQNPRLRPKPPWTFKGNIFWHISSLQEIILTTPIDNDMKIILTHNGHGECVYL